MQGKSTKLTTTSRSSTAAASGWIVAALSATLIIGCAAEPDPSAVSVSSAANTSETVSDEAPAALPVAQILRQAATQPIDVTAQTPPAAPSPSAPIDQQAKVEMLMSSMNWKAPRTWDPRLSGPKMFDRLWSLKGIRLGTAGSSRRLVVFSDPGTGFDLALTRQIHAAGSGLDADILVLPLGTAMFDPSSGAKVTALSCLSDPASAWTEWSLTPPDANATNQAAWGVFLSRHTVPESCDKGPALVEILEAAQAMGVGYTPYVVFPDGQEWPTAIPELSELLATLDYQRTSIDQRGVRVLNE